LSSQFGRGLRSQIALHWIDALLHWIVHALPSAAVLDDVIDGSGVAVAAHAPAVTRQMMNPHVLIGVLLAVIHNLRFAD
jgi:hypothetical protein